MEKPADNRPVSVSVLLPAFNEGETISSTVRRLKEICPEYEVLVIDDGSTDDTASVAEAEGARVIRNKSNRGYGAALKRGMCQAGGKIIVFMDADGQHDCRDIKRLLEALKESDMAVGARSKEDMVAHRKPGKWLLAAVADYLAGQPIPDINSGFRAFYREDGLRYLAILPNGFSLTSTITLAMMNDGREVAYIPLKIFPRSKGRSTVRYFYDGGRTLLLILRVIMLFNPLKIFVPLSIILFLLGGLYTVIMLVLFSNIADTTTILLLAALGTLFVGLIADQISNIRRGG